MELGCITQRVLKRCKTSHHSHNTSIHHLPQDILSDILSRLPAESLISNKLVSKLWYNLISHTKFVETHLTRTRHQWEYQQALVFKHSKLKGEFLPRREYQLMNFTPWEYYQALVFKHSKLKGGSLPKREYQLMNFTQDMECQVSKFEFEYELPDFEYLNFHSSCDGLLLFSHILDNKELYVFNPVTRKYRVLPILETDEEVSISDCTLIYDASIQKYKVVGISTDKQRCYLYTLDRYHGSNKGITEQFTSVAHGRELVMPYEESDILSSPVIVDNKLHWLASPICDFKEVIVYTMDVSKEEFKETKIPFLTPGDWGKNTILEFMGSLCVTDYPENLKQLDIWTLQDREKGEWTKRSIPFEFELRMPGYHVGTSIFQTRILISHKNQIFIYDLKNKDWKTINLPVQEAVNAYFVHTNSLVKWD